MLPSGRTVPVVDDNRRSVTIRLANLERVRSDDGAENWVRQPSDEWESSCAALRDAVASCASLRHTGGGVDWNTPSESLETTWVLIVDCVGSEGVDEVRTLVEEWPVTNERTAAWFLVAEPDVARGAFLQSRPR